MHLSVLPKASGSAMPVAASAGQGATREVLLKVAEHLFSERGFEGTSVRDIVRAAGTNQGAINYHFGSKERLGVEVYARGLARVNRERIALLDALESAAGGKKLRLDQVVEAFIRPAMAAEKEEVSYSDDLMRLTCRCFQEPNPELKKFMEEQFTEVARRFHSVILKAVPDLSPGELFWRMNFLIGALHRGQEVWLQFDKMPCPQGIQPEKPDFEGLIQRLVAFVTAGLGAKFSKAV